MQTLSVIRACRRFARSDEGAISVWSLLLLVAAGAIGAVAVDVTYLSSLRTQLQVAADAGAHAAVFRANQAGVSNAQARTDAMAVMEYTVPEALLGNVITTSSIQFGSYDAEADTFRVNSTSDDAAFVVVNLEGANAVDTFLFRLAGIDEIEVGASAVAVATGGRCATLQGMFGEEEVTPNSNNIFGTGICVHSQDGSSVQNNPLFEPGAYISAPDEDKVTCQNNCTGFEDARHSASYDLSQFYDPLQGATSDSAMLTQVQQVLELMPNWSWTGINTVPNPVSVTDGTHLTPAPSFMGRVNYVNCNGGNLTLSGSWTRTVLLLNDCKVKVDSNLVLSDAVLYNTREDDRTSFNFGSGRRAANLVVGNDTDCNGTGAGYIFTRGGFDAPAKMTLNNGTIIARGDVKFASQFGGADGRARGMSVVAGGEIDTASNSAFAACPPSAASEPILVTYRLAR